jgi:hypothetical protein
MHALPCHARSIQIHRSSKASTQKQESGVGEQRKDLVGREDEVKPPRIVLLRKLIEINARPEGIEPEHLPGRGVPRRKRRK